MVGSLPVINLETAKFECIYGRGCEGICCHNGRPPVYPEEIEAIDANLAKFLPELRSKARTLVEKKGYLSNRRKLGLPMLRTVDSWCVFFNQGCVLHKVAAAEGDTYRYKPAACALFPLAKDENDQWYVRQKDYKGEPWNLFCLEPNESTPPARETVQDEVQLAARYDREADEARQKPQETTTHQ